MSGSILIVDDDPVQRRLLQAAMAKFGYSSLVAEEGEAGLALMDGPSAREVSVVILDLSMPGLDGVGVLKAMRRSEERRVGKACRARGEPDDQKKKMCDR